MAVSKVVYDGNTLIDLTSDTVTADTLVSGVTAHNAAGVSIVGTASFLPLSGGTISGDLTVSGTLNRSEQAELIASGTLTGGGTTWYVTSSYVSRAKYKSFLLIVRTIVNNGNKYMTWTLPTVADTWGLMIPYGGSDYFRATATIVNRNESSESRLTFQVDSSGYSTYVYVYAMP